MALDPHLRAAALNLGELDKLVQHSRRRGFASANTSSGAVSLVHLPHYGVQVSALTPRVDLKGSVSNVYDYLEREAVIALGGSVDGCTIPLSGGSAATCYLDLSGRELQVVKRIKRGGPMVPIDGHDRHLLEGQWLSGLTDDARNHFPRVTVSQNADAVEARMQFVPAYTFGEMFFQRRIGHDQAKRFVTRSFAALERMLYVRKCDKSLDETYTDKIRRRRIGYARASRDSDSVERAFTHPCRINGELCRPLDQLLDIVDASRDLREVLRTPEPRICHGDFIPEDVLFLQPSCEPAFIDPNPLNTDPLLDLSKLTMACAISYDCAVRDEVYVNYETLRELNTCAIGVNAPYADIAERMQDLGKWIVRNARNLVSADVLPSSRLRPEYIELLAGLHALAIPEFHAAVHDRTLRANYFLRSGQLVLERALVKMGR